LRYEDYKKETTIARLEVLRAQTFPGTKQEVFHLDVFAKSGNFANDVEHGWVTFVAGMVSPVEPLAMADADASATAFSAPTVCMWE